MKLGEALSQRVARERLEALNKFIPVHERIKEKLQSKQQMKTDLFAGRQEMYKPITTSVESILYGKPDDVSQLDKKPIAGLLKEISESVKPVAVPAAEVLTKQEKKDKDLKRLQNRFTENLVTDIQKFDVLTDLPIIAVSTFNDRNKYLTKKGDSAVNTKDKWVDALYKLRTSTTKISQNDMIHGMYKDKVKDVIEQTSKSKKLKSQQKEQAKRQLPPQSMDPYLWEEEEQEWDIQSPMQQYELPSSEIKSLPVMSREDEEIRKEIKQKLEQRRKQFRDPYSVGQQVLAPMKQKEDPEKKGSGIKSHISTYYDSQICPDSIVRDVSRLEVLIGGRKAGNNSPEIINESADIAQRLFQANIIDLHNYREFIDDLMEDKKYLGYHSD